MRKQKNEDQTWDVAGRIKALEQFSGPLVVRPRGRGRRDPDPRAGAAPGAPCRAARASSCRGAEGFGVYADLTLTAPRAAPD